MVIEAEGERETEVQPERLGVAQPETESSAEREDELQMLAVADTRAERETEGCTEALIVTLPLRCGLRLALGLPVSTLLLLGEGDGEGEPVGERDAEPLRLGVIEDEEQRDTDALPVTQEVTLAEAAAPEGVPKEVPEPRELRERTTLVVAQSVAEALFTPEVVSETVPAMLADAVAQGEGVSDSVALPLTEGSGEAEAQGEAEDEPDSETATSEGLGVTQGVADGVGQDEDVPVAPRREGVREALVLGEGVESVERVGEREPVAHPEVEGLPLGLRLAEGEALPVRAAPLGEPNGALAESRVLRVKAGDRDADGQLEGVREDSDEAEGVPVGL